MTRSLLATLVALCALGLQAQTPAPSAKPSAPLRHLRYSFSASVKNVNGRWRSEFRNSDPWLPTGGNGTVDVDVVSLAPDGALIVRVSQHLREQLHDEGAYTCAVYGDTTVVCPSHLTMTAAQWVLLSYLGRRFVDGAPWDASHHWQRKTDTSRYTLLADFTLLDEGDAQRPAVVREAKKISMRNGGFDSQAEDVEIVYDRAMEIPTSVHDEVRIVGAGLNEDATYDFRLTADSFAKPTP